MKSFQRVKEVIAVLRNHNISDIIIMVEATGNGGHMAEVCRYLGYEPILLTAGMEKKYSMSVRQLTPEIYAIENAIMYKRNAEHLKYCIEVLENNFNLMAIITPNEAPSKVVASMDLKDSIKRALPGSEYSSKITQREKLNQQVPSWRVVRVDRIEEVVSAYNTIKDGFGRVMLKQHMGVGKRGIHVCMSEKDIFDMINNREMINNYGVPVDDGLLIVEEYIPHSFEMSCDIATFREGTYLVGSPVYKKSGGSSGIVEVSHRVGGWVKDSDIRPEKVLSGIKKAKDASYLMKKNFDRIDHVELMLDDRTGKWVITEVNFGRPGGDSLPKLQKKVLNIDPVEIGLKVLLDKITKDEIETIDTRSVGAIFQSKVGVSGFFIADKTGTVTFNEQWYNYYRTLNTNYISINLDVICGETVGKTVTSYNRCGNYLLKANDATELDRHENEMLKNLQFCVN